MVLFPFLAPALRNRESSRRLPAAGYRVELSLRSEADRTQEIIEIRRLIGTEIRGVEEEEGVLAVNPGESPPIMTIHSRMIQFIRFIALACFCPPRFAPVSERKEGPNSLAVQRILGSFWFR